MLRSSQALRASKPPQVRRGENIDRTRGKDWSSYGVTRTVTSFMHMTAGLFMSLAFNTVTIGVNLRKLKIDVTVAQSFLIKLKYGRPWY